MERCEVAIVGGGPVGLLLGGLLARRGIDVRVLERDGAPRGHTRAIGVHPPGLSCLAEVGVAERLVSRGVCVRRGRALTEAGELGVISFERLRGGHPFVLCVPQAETERALEEALPPGVLMRGLEVEEVLVGHERVQLGSALQARFVVGADGKHSLVRRAMEVAFPGGPYDERFLMGDVADDTPFGGDAAIFLTRGGVVESFPLPGGVRRWVVGTGVERPAVDPALLERLVRERTGFAARAATNTMISGFTAERHLARTFAAGRAILAGDAAHVVSPIGGQGMNLGWLDAAELARALVSVLREGREPAPLLARYTSSRRRAAARAIRRSEMFMRVGRARRFGGPRDVLVRALLRRPLASWAAELFTMRGLHAAGA